MGRPYYIFGQFRETAQCRDALNTGTGFVVLSHHSLVIFFKTIFVIFIIIL